MESSEQLIAKIQHYYEWLKEENQKIEDAHFIENQLAGNRKKDLEAQSYVIDMCIEVFEDVFKEIIYKD